MVIVVLAHTHQCVLVPLALILTIATWHERQANGWDPEKLRVEGLRMFDGKPVKVINWVSIKGYLSEKERGVDYPLIIAGQFEQRVREELGC